MTTTADAFPLTPQPEREPNDPRRRKYGRPLVIPPGGKPGDKLVPYTRCTTFVDCLDDKFKLQQWQQRMVALGLAQRPDLLLSVSAHSDDRDKLDELCDAAREAATASAAATTGTAVHRLTERLDRGEDLGVIPDAAAVDVKAYEQATAALTALHIERFLVNDELRVGGTPDRVVEYGGRNYIADLKTGSIDFAGLKIAMQLAMYAHSQLYDVPTGARSALPDVDLERAIVIHLPAGSGKCTLHWIDIAAGWEAVQIAKQVREWRNRGRKLLTAISPGELPPPQLDHDPMTNDAAQAYMRLRNDVASAQSVEQLGVLWRDNRDRWNDELTQLAAARKSLLMGVAS